MLRKRGEPRQSRTFERGAKRFDGAPIDLAVFRELRKVMDEGGVNHAVRLGCPAAQTLQVFKITSMHLGTPSDKRLGARIRASETEHLMARADQLLNNGGADKAGRSGDEYTHRFILCSDFRGCVRSPVVIEVVIGENTIHAVSPYYLRDRPD